MTDLAMYQALEDIFQRIDDAVEAEDVDDIDAADAITHLTKEGGGIEVLGDTFEPQHDHVQDVVDRAPAYDHTYGIDGSTTKDLSFNNGLIISAAVATAGVAGKDTATAVSRRGTISVVPYFNEKDIEIDAPSGDADTRVYVNQFPHVTERTRDLPKWITSIARTYAEGSHFRWIVEDVDAPLFVDGPLYPPDIFSWVLYDQVGNTRGTPAAEWSSMVQKILQTYINAVERCIRDDIPVFGVQKSTTATRVLDALEDKSSELAGNLPWNDDAVLFNSALSGGGDVEGATLSYTPWYIEHKVDIGSRGGLVEPLKDYRNIELNYGDYDEYKRAFFFVRPPAQTTVLRVGVPRLLFNGSYSPSELRDIALSAIAEQYKEPTAVLVADSKARIPRELREQFRKLITSEGQKGRNEQRGFDQFEE